LIVAQARATGPAGGPYLRGCLAIREGPLLEAAVGALAEPPDVVLVNATGRDHPRRAGLAIHLGALLNIPTVGITHRPLVAVGDWPPIGNQGSFAPLLIGEEVVGYWVRTQQNRRPLAVHAGWRTSPDTARDVVLGTMSSYRTPEPLREARRLARTTRHQGD
jgi:deoxyribonuclease V